MTWTKWFVKICFWFSLFFLNTSFAQRQRKSCKNLNDNVQHFINNLTVRYDNFRIPNHEQLVQIEIHVQQIIDLSASSSDFEVDLFFSEIWSDPRLEFHGSNLCQTNFTLSPEFEKKFWTPNVCIWNAKLSLTQHSPVSNKFLILYSDGKVWRNHRMILRAPCRFRFAVYPFDSVECQLIFQSYMYNLKELRLQWYTPLPVTLLSDILLDDYFFVNYTLGRARGGYPDGAWDQAVITFYFKRRFVYYLLKTYIPSTLTVVVSWITFFMEAKFISARVSVGVSALLTLSAQFGTLDDFPRASELKGNDIWMLICIFFVFSALVELAFAARVVRWQRRKNLKNITVTTFKNILRCKYENHGVGCFTILSTGDVKISSFTANRLDRLAIYIFPAAFLFCNLVYWSYFLYNI